MQAKTFKVWISRKKIIKKEVNFFDCFAKKKGFFDKLEIYDDKEDNTKKARVEEDLAPDNEDDAEPAELAGPAAVAPTAASASAPAPAAVAAPAPAPAAVAAPAPPPVSVPAASPTAAAPVAGAGVAAAPAAVGHNPIAISDKHSDPGRPD